MSKKLPINYENKFCYNIIFNSSFDSLADEVSSINDNKYDKICIVTDSQVEKLYLNEVVEILSNKFSHVITFSFDSGEKSKNLGTIEKLYSLLIENMFSRKDLLVALGGGVVGDMTGFAAATYLRGIDFIQIPTTLLSQVDSSIGGKTGVDFMQYKNMVGAFYMPRLVYMNLNVLNSLDDEQFACGMGEVIKYGCIKDENFFDWLEKNASLVLNKQYDALEHMVYTCCQIKKEVVEIDPKENGIRSYLNFGHTFGHAIEKTSDFSLFHGQCVAIGMVAAAYLSQKLSYLTSFDVEKIKNLILTYHLPASIHETDRRSILNAMHSDKKAVAGRIKFVVLRRIGEADSYYDFTDDDFSEALDDITD